MTTQQQIVADRLVALKLKHGAVTPEIVVADAKHPASPLHGLFEWDLKTAAHRHWIERARELIRSVKVEVQLHHTTISTVRYVHDPYAEQEQGFADVLVVRNNHDWSVRVLDEELKRLQAQLDRSRALSKTLGMEHRIYQFLHKALAEEGGVLMGRYSKEPLAV